MAKENNSGNGEENLNLLTTSTPNDSLKPENPHSTNEQQPLSPYRLQLEGRRRLNTLERIRDRYETHDSTNSTQQFQNNYTVKPEELEDPIIRRALERFDEKSRSLAQAPPTNYDAIQDPITRRALMRLDTNLKRTIPSAPPSTNNDPNETWFTNSFTLGSLQNHNDNRPMRYPDTSVPPVPLNRTSHVSVHQRFCSTSSNDMSEPSSKNIMPNNDEEIPIMRVPAQPIYVTSTNHHPFQPTASVRQRSHSEDMLSSRELSVTEIKNPDFNDLPQLKRNHSSDQLQQQSQQDQPQESSLSNEVPTNINDLPVPNTILKSLDPNFVRTAEASVNYASPTQTYAAYSCEYTRPHPNPSMPNPKLELPPRNYQQSNENGIQPPIPASSAFSYVNTPTNNHYNQQTVSTPSYTAMYNSQNPNQAPYTDDPMYVFFHFIFKI